MGRFATSIAASATHADNLPVVLPKVSLLDALLPRTLTPSVTSKKTPSESKKPINSKASLPQSTAGDSEIKRDKRGRLVMVRHRGSLISNEPITLEDVKKDKKAEGNGSGKGKEENAKDDKKEAGSGEFTAEEDSKLKELKGSTTSWNNIAAAMGRSHADLKKRWKEIEGTAGGEDTKAPGEKKTGAFTAAEDARLKELKALTGKQVKPWKEIAEEMGRDQQELKDHWNDIKSDGDNKPKGKDDSDKTKEGKGEDKKQQKVDKFVFTADEDNQLRELMKSGANFKTCAKQLKKPPDAIRKRWEEIGGGGEKAEEAPKADEKKSDTGKEEKKESKEGEKKKPSSSASKNKDSSSKKAPSIARSSRSTRSEVRFTMQEWMTLQEDEFFTFQELQLLCRILGKDPDQSWLSTACKFYDETGRRVHPDDIREKFEAMARMG